jgi:Tol biopolymer transport system component
MKSSVAWYASQFVSLDCSVGNQERHMKRGETISRVLWALGLLAVACSDNNGPHQGLNIISGDNQVDTVNSYLTIPLTIQVLHSDGSANAQHPVRFGSNGIVLISPISDPGFVTDGISEMTDANGEAAVLLRFKQYAGRDFVQVTDETSNQFLRAYYTVLPGAPAAVRAEPRDTVVYVGGNVTLRPYITDAYGNRRPDTPTFSYTSLNSALSITSSGKATAAAIGRGAVQVGGLSFTDTVWTSVVPQGRFAAIQGPGLVGYIVVANLDGSSFDTIPNSAAIARTIDWSPTGDTLAMDAYSPGRLVTMDLAGHTKLVLGANSISLSEYNPRYSNDGAFIYFASIDSLTHCYGVWRVHPTGMALEHVVADTIDCAQPPYYDLPSVGYYYASSLSPDNSQLVYRGRTLRVRTLATGADTSLGVLGNFPQWSPTGEWIAYDSLGTLMLIHPDGTGQVALLDRKDPDAVPGGAPRVAWSPDGQWLLYFGLQPGVFGGLWLVQVGTGLRMPLQFASGLTWPTWHP